MNIHFCSSPSHHHWTSSFTDRWRSNPRMSNDCYSRAGNTITLWLKNARNANERMWLLFAWRNCVHFLPMNCDKRWKSIPMRRNFSGAKKNIVIKAHGRLLIQDSRTSLDYTYVRLNALHLTVTFCRRKSVAFAVTSTNERLFVSQSNLIQRSMFDMIRFLACYTTYSGPQHGSIFTLFFSLSSLVEIRRSRRDGSCRHWHRRNP